MANEKRLDLISRTALIAEYDRVHIGPPGGARKLMEDAPTVDAVEVVHGRWEKQLGIDHCSVCHKVRPYDVQADIVEYWYCNYCPNCGAKMDGGNGDG